jgi:hypothetical protein
MCIILERMFQKEVREEKNHTRGSITGIIVCEYFLGKTRSLLERVGTEGKLKDNT